jgi:hypothetical protein
MTATVIPFPMHRVRRPDPLTQFYQDQAALAAASFVASLNVLRALYGLPPLDRAS